MQGCFSNSNNKNSQNNFGLANIFFSRSETFLKGYAILTNFIGPPNIVSFSLTKCCKLLVEKYELKCDNSSLYTRENEY